MALSCVAVMLSGLAACTDPAGQREAECVAATAGGAALGGLVGNQIGAGTGNTLATAAGVAAGAVIGNTAANC
ncbi:MAG: glycine zipper 2TM domain-containing protein [Paracoccaceae bacterium]